MRNEIIVVDYSILVPYQYSNNSTENVRSEIENNRISDFGENGINEDNDINEMMKRSRPYSKTEFNQPESTRYEVNNSCELIPSSSMIRYEKDFYGIYLFIDQNVQLTNLMINQGKQLAYLLSSLSQQVFHLSIQTIYLFRDIDSGMQFILNYIFFIFCCFSSNCI
jgi:hypothetical protein